MEWFRERTAEQLEEYRQIEPTNTRTDNDFFHYFLLRLGIERSEHCSAGRTGSSRSSRPHDPARPTAPVVALCLVAVGSSGASTSATVPGAESDVRLLAQQLEAVHPDLFDSVPRARFRSAVDSAAARADELSENELLVELMRIAALPGNGNGHSGIFPGDPQHRRDIHFYPLRLYAFPDGTYVVDEKGSDGLVGARITAVGGVPYAEVAKRVRPLVPHDNASNLQGSCRTGY